MRARIDAKIKDETAGVLAATGLTVSDAFRMMLMRTVAEKQLPFHPLVPNAETIKAMQAARRGDTKKVTTPENLLANQLRTIERTTRFKCYRKREAKGRHRKSLDSDLLTTTNMLAEDAPRPASYRDHSLTGDWQDHRDCHIKPDPTLIYRKPDPDSLHLARLVSHSELSL